MFGLISDIFGLISDIIGLISWIFGLKSDILGLISEHNHWPDIRQARSFSLLLRCKFATLVSSASTWNSYHCICTSIPVHIPSLQYKHVNIPVSSERPDAFSPLTPEQWAWTSPKLDLWSSALHPKTLGSSSSRQGIGFEIAQLSFTRCFFSRPWNTSSYLAQTLFIPRSYLVHTLFIPYSYLVHTSLEL